VSQENKDKADAAEARTQQTKGFMQQVRVVLSISEMGHFLNRTLWHDQAALTSSLRPWL